MGMINGRLYRLTEIKSFPMYIKLEPVVPEGYFDIPSEDEMKIVEEWCIEHDCGRRSGWNKFFFADEAKMTMFKLRWM